MFILGIGVSQVYAGSSITQEYDTEKWGIYEIRVEYSGDKEFFVFWDGNRIADIIPHERVTGSTMEVFTTSEKTTLMIFDPGNVDELTAEIIDFSVTQTGKLTDDQIAWEEAHLNSQTYDKDARIAELEARVQALEDEKLDLEREIDRLNGLVADLQNQISQITQEFVTTVQNQFQWFQEQLTN